MDLPLKPQQIDVPVDDGDIVFHFRPLDDAQLIDLYGMDDVVAEAVEQAEANGTTPGAENLRSAEHRLDPVEMIRSGQLQRVAAQAYIGATCADGEPLTVGGEPFDPSRQDHFGSLKFVWRLEICADLISGGAPVTEELLGNSTEPASPSPRDTARSAPSPSASVGS